MRYLRFAAFSFVAASFAAVHADQLVTNGGFDLKGGDGYYGLGWDIIDANNNFTKDNYIEDWGDAGYTDAPVGVSSFLGYADDDDVQVCQTISTAGYSAGVLSFDVYSDGYDFTNYDFLTVTFGGVEVSKIDLGSDSGTPWKAHKVIDLTTYFDGSDKTLSLRVQNDSSFATWSWVDNIGLDARPTTVPEPATMLCLGLGAVGIIRRRRAN